MPDMETAILDQIAHRPWPLPHGPWVLEQTWRDVLFAHWPVDVDAVRARVPPALELDLFREQAWVSLVAFRIDPFRTRGVPLVLRFPELNLRTYVRRGGKQGICPGCCSRPKRNWTRPSCSMRRSCRRRLNRRCCIFRRGRTR